MGLACVSQFRFPAVVPSMAQTAALRIVLRLTLELAAHRPDMEKKININNFMEVKV